ncbi:MAG: T9SS type A sorting domain-containing protein [Bacteroidetes bacterium]|nr:MAG: T9SS type A sorting domain-containing protein [Bacteroidota bacterium]
MLAALNNGTINKLFGAGNRSFTLKGTDLSGGSGAKIFKMLPGGSTPAVLLQTNAAACIGFTTTATYDCAVSWPNVPIQASGSAKGSINNVLLAQTMTLFFNIANSANLGTIKIEGNKLTFNNLACGSSTPGSLASIQYIPCTVFNYLNANYTGTGHPNINDLYDLANKVLGAVVTTISASDMNAALNAINVGFDKGKALMKQEITCSVPVTRAGSQIMNEVTAQKPVITAYPNPFNDQVRFILQATESGKATLDIYNMVGQKVKTAFQGQLVANSPQTVEYKIPAHSPSENLIYIFRINSKQFTGKLINIRN